MHYSKRCLFAWFSMDHFGCQLQNNSLRPFVKYHDEKGDD